MHHCQCIGIILFTFELLPHRGEQIPDDHRERAKSGWDRTAEVPRKQARDSTALPS